MKITDKFKPGKTLFAFELLPPLKGDNIDTIFDTIGRLAPYNPSYINVTYHREEVKLIERPDGLLERRVVRKRPGTVGIAAAITARYGIDVAPHLICGGFSKFDIEDALIDLSFLGIDNVLALRGDNIRGERTFRPAPGGHPHACDLVSQIMNMNRGEYLDSELEHAKPTSFCIGVAGYPEKHAEAPNLAADIAHLKTKIDAGASYVVTQMFFDNAKYFAYVDACRAAGITVPIVAGLKPFTTKTQLSLLPQTFGVELPDDLVRAVENCKDNAAVREVGIEWAIRQGRELIAAGVPALHFYTMGKADNVERIAKELFG
ncbi:methylenetetrahydrofolate reductase [NAD(P)H] [Rikenella microfusus]|uniref:Methylenetetrahydrofolate reductase n=1 Tax=Rikenella microfusus TaxID=28139 RepID=A0A379MTW3_9BACT|nr:methylenetetrahydrofolate reductase [NAD(P)H] [Rikenella microfusus]SUE34846.1 5,10-methylenetetrahydrofolate reductase [Rikenella microfusus]